MSPADLEILISEATASAYSLILRFRLPAEGQDKRLTGRWTLDEAALRACELNAMTYGETLADQVFAQPAVRAFVATALAVAASHETPLHLRLFIAPEVEMLHALRWETLRLPGSSTPLATGEQVRFSRYLHSGNWQRVVAPQRDALRTLVAIASPDVTGTTLAQVRTDEELRAARAGLGEIQTTELAGRGRVTLENLLAHLRDGCDILYLVAHGMLVDGEPQVLLEQADGGRAWTSGRELAARLGELAHPPILVVLVSCQSAGTGEQDGGALAGLGPRLAAAGVPAVVAMQGNVSMDTAAAFMPVFLAELRRDGQVDRAMAVARGAVRERYDWWMPVLFTRLEDGRLFQLPAAASPAEQSPLEAARALLASLALDKIPAVGDLPPGSRLVFKPNPLFVGREDDLRTLAKILKGGGTAAVGQVAAATGLGGIGKTQLAVEFAHRYGRFFAGGVFWLSCADPNAVPAEVVACGLAMGLPAFETLDFPDQVRRVQQVWQEPIPRLLIFDNCEEEGTLDEWRPAMGGCRVLVTSRRAAWSAGLGVRRLSLPTLPRGDSVALLRRFRADLAEEDPVLDAIAEELGDLPLALHLAGNFLQRYQRDVTPTAYLRELRRPDLLTHRSLVKGDWSPTEHETHVGRTFALGYDRLEPEDAVDALALALLARLACFAPGEPVARDLLLLTLERKVDGSDYEAADALHKLIELGLMDTQEDGRLVIHRLVAAFVSGLAGDEEAQWAVEQALGQDADRINRSAFPARLLTRQVHLRHVTDRALERGDEQTAWLCNELGSHLHQTGDLSTAQLYLQQALTIARRVLGEDHPHVAASLNNLGGLFNAMGNLPSARIYYEQALIISRETLGEDHPFTATCLNNIGSLLQAMGDLASAQSYLEQSLAIRRQALGDNHPDTATTLNNIGSLLQAMGDLAAARPYLEQALIINREALGEDHLSTATCLNNIGSLLQTMGDLASAQSYLKQALAIRCQILGEAHPDTATSLNNLGMLLKEMGDLVAAGHFLGKALVVRRQVLGENHPNTASTLNNLGTLFQSMGDLAGARLCYEQALLIKRQALGENHPDTAASLNNLGMLLQAMGDFPASQSYLEQALVIKRHVLGANHPDTALSLNNMGSLLKAMGDLAGARLCYEQALLIKRQALGEDHPDTAASLNNLGMLLQAMGDLPAARPYLEQAVAIAERSLGPDHPNTHAGRRNLERLLDEMGTAAVHRT